MGRAYTCAMPRRGVVNNNKASDRTFNASHRKLPICMYVCISKKKNHAFLPCLAHMTPLGHQNTQIISGSLIYEQDSVSMGGWGWGASGSVLTGTCNDTGGWQRRCCRTRFVQEKSLLRSRFFLHKGRIHKLHFIQRNSRSDCVRVYDYPSCYARA